MKITLIALLLFSGAAANAVKNTTHTVGARPPSRQVKGQAEQKDAELPTQSELDREMHAYSAELRDIARYYLGNLRYLNSFKGRTVNEKIDALMDRYGSGITGALVGGLGFLDEVPGKSQKEKRANMKAMLAMFGGEDASMAEKFEILRRLLRLIDRAEKDKLVKVPPRAELRSLQKTLGSIVGGVPEAQRGQAAKFLEALGGEDGFVNHRDLVPVVDSLLSSDAFLDLVVRDAVPILFPGAENEKARRFLLALYPDAKDPGGGEGGGSGPKSQYAEEMRALYFDTARKDKAFRSYLFKQVGRVAIGTMREMGVELPRPGEPLPKHDGPASREFDIESLGGYLKVGAELGGKIQLVPSEDPVHDLPEGAARKLMDVVRRVQWPDGLPVRALSESMRGEVPSVRIYRDPKNGDGLLVSQQK